MTIFAVVGGVLIGLGIVIIAIRLLSAWFDYSKHTENTRISYKRFKNIYNVAPQRWDLKSAESNVIYYQYGSKAYELIYFSMGFWDWLKLKTKVKAISEEEFERKHNEQTAKEYQILIQTAQKDIDFAMNEATKAKEKALDIARNITAKTLADKIKEWTVKREKDEKRRNK